MFPIQSLPMRDIWCLLNLGQFDPINRMILLTVIPLSGAHYSSKNILPLTLQASASLKSNVPLQKYFFSFSEIKILSFLLKNTLGEDFSLFYLISFFLFFHFSFLRKTTNLPQVHPKCTDLGFGLNNEVDSFYVTGLLISSVI